MPTIDIPDKICPHCGGIRWSVRYHKKSKNNTRYTCVVKISEVDKKYQIKRLEIIRNSQELIEKRRQRYNNYYQNNKEKVKSSQKKYIQSEKGKKKRRAVDKKQDVKKRKNLANVYVRKALKHHFKIPVECITDDIMNKYRIYLTSKRQLKQLENEKRERFSK